MASRLAASVRRGELATPAEPAAARHGRMTHRAAQRKAAASSAHVAGVAAAATRER